MAQRRLNKNLVVGLVVGLMVVSTAAVIGLLVVYRGPEQEAAPFVRMAIEAYESGKLENAIKAYAQAFGRTRDPSWLVAQGQAALDAGEAGGALRYWDRAIAEDPGLIAAHEARVKLRLKLTGPRPRPHLSSLLRSAAEALHSQDPDNPLAHFGLGVALTGLEQEDPENRAKGIAEVEKAHELAPGDQDIATSLAGVYEITAQIHRREKEIQEADEYRKKAEDVYRVMIKTDPNSAEGYLAYASFLMDRLRMDTGLAAAERKELAGAKKADAMKQIEEKLLAAENLDPNAPKLGMRRAGYWQLAGKPEKVIEALQNVIETTPDFLDAYPELANRYYRSSKLAEAVKVLDQGLAQKVNRFGYKGENNKRKRFRMLCLACEVTLAQAQGKSKNRDEYLARAEEMFNQAVAEKGASNSLVRRVEGQLREAQGNYLDAQRAYEAANDMLFWAVAQHRAAKTRILLRLARLYLRRLRAPGEAIKVLNSVLKTNPGNLIARLMRAEAYLATGQAGEAVSDAKRVLVSVKHLKDDTPIVREAMLLAMQGYSQSGNIEEVKKIQRRLGAQTPQDKLRQAMVYQLEKENDKAAEAYKALLKDKPADKRVLMRAISFFTSIDKRDEAWKLLRAAQAKKPEEKYFNRLALVLDEKLSDKERNQRMLAQLKETKDDFSRELSLFQYYVRGNDLPAALKHLQAARKAKPDDPALLEREFALALKLRDWALAERCWQQAVQLDADGVGGRSYKGRIPLLKAELEMQEAQKLGRKDLAKSREHREKAKALYPEAAKQLREGVGIYEKSSKVHYWLGVAEEGMGNLVEARDAYVTAVELDPTNAAAHRSLAKLGKTYRNVANVEHHLKEAIRLGAKDRQGLPLDPWLRMDVENEREQQDPRSALKRREALRKKDPKDIYNLLRLALLYERVQETDKADKCIADALKVQPENLALAWDASRYYRRNKQVPKAEQLLHKLVSQTQGDEKAQAQRMVAQHHVSAWRQLKSKGSASRQEVELVEKAADAAFKAATELPGASAAVYTEAASFCQETFRRREAIEWLRKGLAVIEDRSYEGQVRQRVIRLLVSSRPVPEDATKAVAEYVKRFPDDPSGLLFRGELFSAQGKLAEAIEEYTAYLDVIGRQGSGASRSARMAEGYFLRGQLYLRRARATYADRQEFLRLAIRDLAQAKAIAPKTFRRSAPNVLLARAYELMGQADPAVRELHAVLEENPEATIAARELVRLYARQKRWEEQEALIRQQVNLFEKSWYWPFVLGGQMETRGRINEAVASLRKACELVNYKVAPGAGLNQPVAALLRVLSTAKRNGEIINIVKTKLKPEECNGDMLAFCAGALAQTGKRAEALAETRKAIAASRSFEEYSRVVRHITLAFGIEQALKLVRAEHAKKADKEGILTLLLSTLLAYDKKPGEALELLGQAVSTAKDPVHKVLCLISQAMLLYENGKKGEAAKVYVEVLHIKKDDLTALNNLAYTLAEDLKNPKDALPYAERAVQLAPADSYVLDTLGWCLFLAGQPQNALGVLLEAIDRNPDLLDAHLHLARLHAGQGRKTEAAGVLRGALERAEEREDQDAKTRVLAAMKELGV